jgi:hypothetical protein
MWLKAIARTSIPKHVLSRFIDESKQARAAPHWSAIPSATIAGKNTISLFILVDCIESWTEAVSPKAGRLAWFLTIVAQPSSAVPAAS